MKILITGANGFIGKNIRARIEAEKLGKVLPITKTTPDEELQAAVLSCDFIIHTAAANRPQNEEDYYNINVGFSQKLIGILKKSGKKIPIIYTSTIKTSQNTPYGISKRQAEELILNYANQANSPAFIYKLANCFGKWARPNYNSVIATFCHNIIRGIPVYVDETNPTLTLIYIDDITDHFIRAIKGEIQPGFQTVTPYYEVSLFEIERLIREFKKSFDEGKIPTLSDGFSKKLFSTYVSYMDCEYLKSPLTTHEDFRGSFTELIKTETCGQFSVNIQKPGITKGNHYHNYKFEKFIVVHGDAEIKLRKVYDDKVLSFKVSGKNQEVITIPPGYTHNITNCGDGDLVTIMWANEIFDPDKPDTYYMEV